MSFTYTGDPSNSVIDAIRIEVGDTLSNQHEAEDEEILYAYSKEGTVVKAAARVCEFLAAKHAKREDFRAAGIQSVKTTVSAKYIAMAKRLRERGITAGSFVAPAMSVDEKESQEIDSDTVQAKFKKGIFDNPDASADVDSQDLNLTGE